MDKEQRLEQRNNEIRYQEKVGNMLLDAFIQNNPRAAYIYKKAEKLSIALYLVTSFVSNEEKLKTSLRERALDLLMGGLSLNNGGSSQERIHTMRSRLFEIVSLLHVAYSASYISEMNFSILSKELLHLARFLEHQQEGASPAEQALTADFFAVDLLNTVAGRVGVTEKEAKKPITPLRTNENVKDIPSSPAPVVSVRHNKRREVILELVRQRGNVKVKDIAAVIIDCSEKTLQRELLALVAEGVLKKEGERRWSTYSLLAI